jgi:predicted  nucleic acid-binding Zn-ribbon protein
MGTIGLEDLSDVDTLKNEVLSLKEEVTSSKKDVKELTQKLENHRTVVTTLAQANEILGNRFRRLERSVEAGRSAQDDLGTAFGEHRGIIGASLRLSRRVTIGWMGGYAD